MNNLEEGVADVLRILLWYPYRWTVSFMPPARELELFRHTGRLLAFVDPVQLRRIVRNLERAFPGRKDLRTIAHQCLESRIEDRYLSLCFEKLDRGTLSAYLSFNGLSRLDDVLAQGRGCILAYPNLGPVMLPLFGLGLLGYDVAQISARDEPDGSSPAALAAYHVRRYLEARVPAAIVDARSYLRPTLRRLKDRQIVLVAYDGSGAGIEVGRRVPVSLLGQRAMFPVGALYLALRSRAPLLPMVTVPSRSTSCYKTVISGELVLEHHGDLRETLRHNAQKLARNLEAVLREHPGAWHLWPEFEPGRMLEPPSGG